MLRTQVVDCEIPLLKSRQSLKQAHCQIDFVQDKLFMVGEQVPFKISRTGHYCMPRTNGDKQETFMDIKFINTRLVLHLIDHATRYSRACLLSNKKPMSVIQAVITHWIQLFGQPVQFLTDNGGEFVNNELLEL